MDVESKDKKQSTAKTKQQSSPVTEFISVRCLVGIQEWLDFVDPVEELFNGFCLEPMSDSDKESVGKKKDQKSQ